ncbi:MAG TPA: hypothetical protein VF092_30320 [Longimicrobium sp.]
MRKLKLDLEALTVESFAVERGSRAGRGTVRGRADATTPTLLVPIVTWTIYELTREDSDSDVVCITEVGTNNRSLCFPNDC